MAPSNHTMRHSCQKNCRKNYVKLVRIGYLWVFYNAYVHVSISLLKHKLLEEGIFALFLPYPKHPQQCLAHYPPHSFVTRVVFLRILIFYKFDLFLLIKPLFKASSCCCHFPSQSTYLPLPPHHALVMHLPDFQRERAVHLLLPCSEKRVFYAPFLPSGSEQEKMCTQLLLLVIYGSSDFIYCLRIYPNFVDNVHLLSLFTKQSPWLRSCSERGKKESHTFNIP